MAGEASSSPARGRERGGGSAGRREAARLPGSDEGPRGATHPPSHADGSRGAPDRWIGALCPATPCRPARFFLCLDLTVHMTFGVSGCGVHAEDIQRSPASGFRRGPAGVLPMCEAGESRRGAEGSGRRKKGGRGRKSSRNSGEQVKGLGTAGVHWTGTSKAAGPPPPPRGTSPKGPHYWKPFILGAQRRFWKKGIPTFLLQILTERIPKMPKKTLLAGCGVNFFFRRKAMD